MKRLVLVLAGAGVLGIAAERVRADGALSYPMAAHVAANYGMHDPGGYDAGFMREVRHSGAYWGDDCHWYYRRPPMARPYWGPRMVMPMPLPPPVFRPLPPPPPFYPMYGYPYRPQYNFRYSSPRFSIGIGF